MICGRRSRFRTRTGRPRSASGLHWSWHPEHRPLLLRADSHPPERQAPLSENLRRAGSTSIGYLDRDVSLGHIARQLVSSLRTVGIPTAGLAYQRNHQPTAGGTSFARSHDPVRNIHRGGQRGPVRFPRRRPPACGVSPIATPSATGSGSSSTFLPTCAGQLAMSTRSGSAPSSYAMRSKPSP